MEKRFRVWDSQAVFMKDDGTHPEGKPHMKYDVGVLSIHSKSEYIAGIDGIAIRPDSKRFPLMQFTGRHDKKGAEIYQGDIVRLVNSANQVQIKSIISEVGFYDAAFCAYWRITELWEGYNTSPSSVLFLNSVTSDQIEIIGNIYSNPDLLPSNLAIDKNK